MEKPITRLEEGVGTFPLFSEPPFSSGSHRYRRDEPLFRAHPSSAPLILLWDENGALPSGCRGERSPPGGHPTPG